MEKEDFLFDINIDFDKDMLYNEFLLFSKNLIPIYSPKMLADDKAANINWFRNQQDWLMNDIKDWTVDTPIDYYDKKSETYRLLCILEETFDIKMSPPRFCLLNKNKEIPFHKDWNCKAGINLIISDNAGPINFADYGLITYKFALINTTKLHGVPAFTNDRILIRFSIPSNMEFNECKKLLQKSNL